MEFHKILNLEGAPNQLLMHVVIASPTHPYTHKHTHVLLALQEKMAECRIIDKLSKFVPVRNDVLLMSVLRLLHNLSFDATMRDDMVKNGLIPKVTYQGQQQSYNRAQHMQALRGQVAFG